MTGQDQNSEDSSLQDLHTTYPPTMPISRDTDNGITETSLATGSSSQAAGELPTINDPPEQTGLWFATNETQRGMQSRHISMIGMSFKYPIRLPVIVSTVL